MVKKVLMVCYGGGHVKIIENIYYELKKEENLEIVIFALTAAQKYLDKVKIPYTTLEDYQKVFKDEEAEKIGIQIIQELDLDFKERESILYYGYSFKQLIEKYGREKAILGYKKFGRRVFLPIDFMTKVLKLEKPDLVLTTNAPRMEKAALICAKKMRIKTISVEDLFGRRHKNEVDFYYKDKIYNEIYGDIICVFSNITKKNLEKRVKSEIIVTGNPNFDTIFKIKKEKINYYDKSICYLSQQTENNLSIVKILLKLLDEQIIKQVILKLHPNEKRDNYLNVIENYKGKVIIAEELYEAIISSSLILTEYSTAGIEAILLGKNVISRENEIIDFKELGETLVYKNLEEIPFLITNYFFYDSLRKKNTTLYTNKDASNKIVQVILKNINKEGE